MRENDKQTLILDDEGIRKMHLMKEGGEYPGDFLSGIANGFFLSLPRLQKISK